MKKQIKAAILLFLTAVLLQGCATTKLTGPPDELYKDGEQSFKNGNYTDAIAQWKKVKESYQSPELSTRAELGIADAYFLNKDFIEAAAAYEDFRKLHPNHEQSGFALYRQAMSYYNQISGIDTDQTPVVNARITLESYLKLYPGTQYTAEVTEKIRDCRDKQLQYEIYVGRFYLKQEKLTAAIARFEGALKLFPDLPRCDEVLYYLGLAYRDAEKAAKARETFERLVKEYPASPFVKNANKALGK
jgi:outer membrane protein assembly factor BamD